MTTFEKKMGGFLVLRGELTDEEAGKLGLKNEQEEVEKFISANTQELGKDKWLCPLSGKKFKGPDFVRKHIMTKHTEKVDEVKKEVNFFNNYLRVSPVFLLICMIIVYHRTLSDLSCLSILRPRQVLEERVAQVRIGGREGEAILTSIGNIFLPCFGGLQIRTLSCYAAQWSTKGYNPTTCVWWREGAWLGRGKPGWRKVILNSNF